MSLRVVGSKWAIVHINFNIFLHSVVAFDPVKVLFRAAAEAIASVIIGQIRRMIGQPKSSFKRNTNLLFRIEICGKKG